MVKLEQYQGFLADLAGVGCLLLSSVTGIHVSTTHAKTTAIMGVGATKRLSSVNWGVVKEMIWDMDFNIPRLWINRILNGRIIYLDILKYNYRGARY